MGQKNKHMNDFNIYELEGNIRLSIGENYNYSPTSILGHLMENPDVKILAKMSWLLTDDYQSDFKYKGYDFVLCTPSDSISVFPTQNDTPNSINQELYDYIKSYNSISILKWLGTWFYVLFLPFSLEP
jgi:hypothetical protein